MIRCVVIDHYDSFTYNLVDLLEETLKRPKKTGVLTVFRQDRTDLSAVLAVNPTHIVLSPGPGSPEDRAYFGVSESILKLKNPYIRIFGVCLGMQGIVVSFGGRLRRSERPFHGKTSRVSHDGAGIFSGIQESIRVMRYHSLEADPEDLPACLEITAKTDETYPTLMGIRHKILPVEGVQFHPESFATDEGKRMIENFLR
ncbi:aminodeoxychorismate/anthranilate synthase component II [Leptospira gomenensis]|uniref:Aminodeoxychorismate/anthranilate synthase component II n=1 Tax=Leptospira gomenensis TaxID=2484974 RepID=A0A5F1YAT9_9LEPT|nr:aminodeoxychorismate/anthranilate synthase component II [Leptospira gomenensis]TGK34519.1 aminodeoxychorismate/anthranilate synthase component II [Leptospira gomenensis]TGK40171.1 aminodeoxychorismate/anthranilate synthase component II [Leptospira gomenensis]TGK41904.1 aminodeoxychorismate/anthranilate synthase component II [Leptospira gomenensis]TGK55680.1 aminodeoxychorismate/anthranilate synthase component II [Leptospira gomenensis]